MSYILDALRRAEADRERGRGAVPGLNAPHGQPMPGLPIHTTASWAAARWVGAGAAGALILGALAWWLLRPAQFEPEPDAAPAAATQAATQATTNNVAPPVTSAPAPPPAELPKQPVPIQPVPMQPEAPVTSRPARAPAPAAKAPVTKAPVAKTPESATTKDPAPTEPVPTFTALPEDLRRAMPKLVISGSVYSADPRSRFIMVNGELGYEGQDVAPGVRLERIAPRQATFSFRGQRFTLPH